MSVPPPPRRPLLTRNDQWVLAILLSLALIFMTATWLASGALWDGLVNIDEAEPLEASFQVDINTAGWAELSQLPEVGETLAKRIVESRDRAGPFASNRDLLRVPGIGAKTLDKVKPYLRTLP